MIRVCALRYHPGYLSQYSEQDRRWTTGKSRIDSMQDKTFFPSAKRPYRLTHPAPIQWLLEVLSWSVKRPRHEADHSPQSSAEVNL
jgi:hypothetical protein